MILDKFKNSRRLQQGFSFLLAAFLISSISYLGVHNYTASNAISGASMQLTPAAGTYTAGSDVSFTIREDSGSIPVNSVQASLTYNPSQLQFVSVTEGGAFPLMAATSTGQAGIIRVARAIQGSELSGDRPIVTVNFKALTSGAAAVSIDRSFSSVVRASDSQNILEAVTNGNYTLTAAATTPPAPASSPTPAPNSGTAKPVLSLLPNGGSYPKGSVIPVAVRVTSSTTKVTVVRGVVKYPANLLEFQDSKDSATFPTANQLKKAADTIDFTRGISGGGSGVTGDNLVITLNFKVIASAGSIPMTFTGASEVYDASGSGQNVLDLLGSKGTMYGIGAASTPTPQTSTVTPPSNTTTPIVRASGALNFTPTKSGSASITADNNTQLKGTVQLAATANPEILAANPGDALVKVEYYLDKKLVATKTEAPFTYNFDTKSLKNGTYVMTVKAFYQSGTVDTHTDNLLVKNPVTLAYVVSNYSAGIFGTVLALAIIAVVAWKFLLPRFLGGRDLAAVPAVAGGGATTFGVAPAKEQSSWEGIAPDPAVVSPNNAIDTSTISADNVLASEQEAAAMTQPLDMQNPQVVTTNTPQIAQPADPLPPALTASQPPAVPSAQPAQPEQPEPLVPQPQRAQSIPINEVPTPEARITPQTSAPAPKPNPVVTSVNPVSPPQPPANQGTPTPPQP